MAASTRSNAAWERVLAAIEADAARAAALVTSDHTSAHAGVEYDAALGETSSDVAARMAVAAQGIPAQGIPSTWRLPANADGTATGTTSTAAFNAAAGAAFNAAAFSAADLSLPDEMPPIPPELVERIERLRDQIASLQADLGTALAEAHITARPLRRPEPPTRPELVDRRL